MRDMNTTMPSAILASRTLVTSGDDDKTQPPEAGEQVPPPVQKLPWTLGDVIILVVAGLALTFAVAGVLMSVLN